MTNSPKIGHITALGSKLIGLVFWITSLIDLGFLVLVAANRDQEWQINLMLQLVERAPFPLLGLALILLGYGIDNMASEGTVTTVGKIDLRLPAYGLSVVLGVVLLLFIPMHLSNVGSRLELAKVNSDNNPQVEQVKQELEILQAIASDPAKQQQFTEDLKKLNTIIESGTVDGQTLNPQQLATLQQQQTVLERFQELAGDPAKIQEEIKTRQDQLAENDKQKDQQARLVFLQQGVRVGLKSFFLGAVYLLISFLGFKDWSRESKRGRRKSGYLI